MPARRSSFVLALVLIALVLGVALLFRELLWRPNGSGEAVPDLVDISPERVSLAKNPVPPPVTESNTASTTRAPAGRTARQQDEIDLPTKSALHGRLVDTQGRVIVRAEVLAAPTPSNRPHKQLEPEPCHFADDPRAEYAWTIDPALAVHLALDLSAPGALGLPVPVHARSGSDGTFSLQDLAAGRWRILIRTPRTTPFERNDLLLAGGADLDLGTIVLEAGEHLTLSGLDEIEEHQDQLALTRIEAFADPSLPPLSANVGARVFGKFDHGTLQLDALPSGAFSLWLTSKRLLPLRVELPAERGTRTIACRPRRPGKLVGMLVGVEQGSAIVARAAPASDEAPRVPFSARGDVEEAERLDEAYLFGSLQPELLYDLRAGARWQNYDLCTPWAPTGYARGPAPEHAAKGPRLTRQSDARLCFQLVDLDHRRLDECQVFLRGVGGVIGADRSGHLQLTAQAGQFELRGLRPLVGQEPNLRLESEMGFHSTALELLSGTIANLGLLQFSRQPRVHDSLYWAAARPEPPRGWNASATVELTDLGDQPLAGREIEHIPGDWNPNDGFIGDRALRPIEAETEHWPFSATTIGRTDMQGRCSFHSLSPGHHTFRLVRHSNQADAEWSVVDLAPGQPVHVRLTATELGAIVGRIAGLTLPLRGLRVTLVLSREAAPPWLDADEALPYGIDVAVDRDGRFRALNLEPGRYWAIVTLPTQGLRPVLPLVVVPGSRAVELTIEPGLSVRVHASRAGNARSVQAWIVPDLVAHGSEFASLLGNLPVKLMRPWRRLDRSALHPDARSDDDGVLVLQGIGAHPGCHLIVGDDEGNVASASLADAFRLAEPLELVAGTQRLLTLGRGLSDGPKLLLLQRSDGLARLIPLFPGSHSYARWLAPGSWTKTLLVLKGEHLVVDEEESEVPPSTEDWQELRVGER